MSKTQQSALRTSAVVKRNVPILEESYEDWCSVSGKPEGWARGVV